MASTINASGLTIETKSEIVTDLTTGYQTIYGADINVQSNSPDGQLINIQAQAITDFNELLLDTYNSFAIDSAYGTRLDQLVALNGLFRKQGTNTIAYVNVTSSQAVNIPGQDQTALTPFTVQDNAGNQYQLEVSYSFGSATTAALAFKAVTIGEIQTLPNTITNIITSTLGITAVNNPSTASDIIGVNEETDVQLRMRHAQSLSLASTGPADSVEAALRNIPDITDAYVVENDTGSTVNGVPAHSQWVIVNGGTQAEIGTAIYSKKGIGCGQVGAQAYIVTRPNGSTFTALWDTALSQVLYIKFSIIWIGNQQLDNADIETALAAALVYKLGQNPTIGDVVIAMQTIAPTAVVTINTGSSQGVSRDDSAWASVVEPTDAQHYFSVLAANITIT